VLSGTSVIASRPGRALCLVAMITVRLVAPRARVWLVQSGLRSIIDLRDSLEGAPDPNVFANSTQIAYAPKHRFPFATIDLDRPVMDVCAQSQR
jgi:hypothetical protein